MTQVHLINLEQANDIRGKEYSHNRFYSPIEDANANWIIGQEEVVDCENEDLIWVKELPLIDYEPKTEPEIF